MNKKIFRLFIFLCVLAVILWAARAILYVYINKKVSRAVNLYEYNVIKEV